MSMQIRKDPSAFQVPKRKAVKEKDYLGFIATLPCIVTMKSGVQVCHLSFSAPEYGHYGRAKGSKAHDRWTLPMAKEMHDKQHSMNERVFWDQHVRINPHVACLVLYGLYNEAGMDALDQAVACIMSGAFRI